MLDLPKIISVARGAEPADLLLENARLVNVLSGEIHPTDIAISGSRIVGLGSGYHAHEVTDLGGRYVCPGFIDAHVHIESALVPPRQFARAVVPHGVTTAITDPHEIANVLGFKSANAAEEHLQALARKGAIDLVSGTSRGIRLKGSSRDAMRNSTDLLACPCLVLRN